MSGGERERHAAFDALTDCFVNLVEAKIDLQWLSRKLFSAKIISLDQLEEADSSLTHGTEKSRRQTLLTIVLRRVRDDMKCFNDFLDALKADQVYSHLVKRLESSYGESPNVHECIRLGVVWRGGSLSYARSLETYCTISNSRTEHDV